MTQSALTEAISIVHGREASYGTPEEFFFRLAIAAEAVLKLKSTPEQLAQLMVLIKMIRQSNGSKWDNIVDQAGYTEIVGRIVSCGKEPT